MSATRLVRSQVLNYFTGALVMLGVGSPPASSRATTSTIPLEADFRPGSGDHFRAVFCVALDHSAAACWGGGGGLQGTSIGPPPGPKRLTGAIVEGRHWSMRPLCMAWVMWVGLRAASIRRSTPHSPTTCWLWWRNGRRAARLPVYRERRQHRLGADNTQICDSL